jgi:hypothetical protein
MNTVRTATQLLEARPHLGRGPHPHHSAAQALNRAAQPPLHSRAARLTSAR